MRQIFQKFALLFAIHAGGYVFIELLFDSVKVIACVY